MTEPRAPSMPPAWGLSNLFRANGKRGLYVGETRGLIEWIFLGDHCQNAEVLTWRLVRGSNLDWRDDHGAHRRPKFVFPLGDDPVGAGGPSRLEEGHRGANGRDRATLPLHANPRVHGSFFGSAWADPLPGQSRSIFRQQRLEPWVLANRVQERVEPQLVNRHVGRSEERR